MNLEIAIQLIDKSRISLLELAKEIDNAGYLAQKIEGEWSTIDILAHITSWERVMLFPLETLLNTGEYQTTVIMDVNSWNAEQAAIWSKLSTGIILDSILDIRKNLLELALKIDPSFLENTYPAPWGGESTLPEMLAGLAWHESEHIKTLREHFLTQPV